MDANHNWIVTAQKDGSPDDICDPFVVYMWSLHWSIMSITSIGYGDWSPQRSEEYIVCIIFMYMGGILYAYIIGGICAGLSKEDPTEEYFRERFDTLNHIMRESNMSTQLRNSIRKYMRGNKTVLHMKASNQDCIDCLGKNLRGEVISSQPQAAYVRQVSYLSKCGTDFIVDVCLRFENDFRPPCEPFERYGRLCVLLKGSAFSNSFKVLVRGEHFGEDFISDSIKLQLSHAVAITYCQSLFLTKAVLLDILGDYPIEMRVLRRQALRLGLKNAARYFVEQFKEEARQRVHDEKMKRNKEIIGKKGVFAFTPGSRENKAREAADLLRPVDSKDMKYLRAQALHKAERLFGDCRLGQLCADYDAALNTSASEQKHMMNSEMRAAYLQDPSPGQVQQLLNDLKRKEAELDGATEQVKTLLRNKEENESEYRELEEEHKSLLQKLELSRKQVSHSRLDLTTLEVKRYEQERQAYEADDMPWPPA
jgi:hypothetical protein